MEPRTTRRTADHGLQLPAEAVEQMRSELPRVAEHVVAAIIDEVPSYTDAFSGPMGETIRNAVQLALGRLPVAGQRPPRRRRRYADRARRRGRLPARPGRGPQRPLDRGAARGVPDRRPGLVARDVDDRRRQRRRRRDPGRVRGAGVRLHRRAVGRRRSPGHTDELATSGRVRQRLLERVAHHLLTGSPVDQVRRGGRARRVGAAEDADRGDRPGGAGAPGARLDLPRRPCRRATPRSSTRACCCWCPTRTHTAAPRCCARSPTAAASPARPDRGWRCGRRTTGRCGPGPPGSRSTPRPTWSRWSSTPTARPATTCAPSCSRRSPTCARAPPRSSPTRCARGCCTRAGATTSPAELFVHPQTVRYRMGQLRELYGDRLDDPETVLALTVALG